MSRGNSVVAAMTVLGWLFCGPANSAHSQDREDSKKNEAFAMQFDKTYEALIERLQAVSRRGFDGVSVDEIVFRDMLDEAKSLAEKADPGAAFYLISQVEDLVDKTARGFGRVSGRYRLALLTLAKLGSDDSREILRNFVYREKTGLSTVIVISYLPQQQGKRLLEEILQTPDRIVEPLVLEWTVSLLAAIGDNKSMTLLKSLNGKEKRLPPNFLTNQLKTMQKRLDIKLEKERAERTKHELLYWQAQHDQLPHRVMRYRYYIGARALHDRNLKIPVELLRSKLPEPTAIAILSFQREKAAIPDLEKLATRDGMIGLMAKEALQAISNPPGNAQD